MDEKIKNLCDRVVADSRKLRKKMVWEVDSNATAIMSAFLYASAGKEVDIDKYVACKKILKKNINAFSEMRGTANTLVLTKMALSDDPEKYLLEARQVYKKLTSLHKLSASPNLVLAALTLYEHGGIAKADENIERLEEIYTKLKGEHPLLITNSDRGFLAMLVTSGFNIDAMIEEIEAGYEANKKVTVFKDSVHSLSQILSLSNKSTQQKADEVKSLLAGFKASKKHISKDFALSSIGALTLLDMPMDRVVAEVTEIDNYLKKQKGFKWYSTAPSFRIIYSQLVMMLAYLPESQAMVTTTVTETIAMVILEEIIMMILIMTAIRTTANSSSSSN